MISTVPTSIFSMVTSAILTSSFAGIVILELAALLIQKELCATVNGGGIDRLKKLLNRGITPLIFIFSGFAVVKLLEVVR